MTFEEAEDIYSRLVMNNLSILNNALWLMRDEELDKIPKIKVSKEQLDLAERLGTVIHLKNGYRLHLLTDKLYMLIN